MFDPTIPHNIHLMWIDKDVDDNETIPAKYVRKGYLEAWKAFHPEWEIFIWNRQKVLNLFQTHPALKRYYKFLTKKLVRLIEFCDFARVGVIYAYGGIYSDCDTRVVNRFDEFVDSHKNLILFFEPDEHLDKKRKNLPYLWNGMLISAKNNPFWLEWMNEIMNHHSKTESVFYNTGPSAFSKFVQDKQMVKKNPEFFENTCLISPCLGNGKISKQCMSFFNHSLENNMLEHNFIYYSSKLSNKIPYNQILSFNLWHEGSAWGKLTLSEDSIAPEKEAEMKKKIHQEAKDRIPTEIKPFDFLATCEFKNEDYVFNKTKKTIVLVIAIFVLFCCFCSVIFVLALGKKKVSNLRQ